MIVTGGTDRTLRFYQEGSTPQPSQVLTGHFTAPINCMAKLQSMLITGSSDSPLRTLQQSVLVCLIDITLRTAVGSEITGLISEVIRVVPLQ